MNEHAADEITQRELRNDSGRILRAVDHGESFTITRNGTPIGRLIPLRRRTFVARADVLAAFASSPVVDPDELRNDLDTVAGQEPFGRAW